MQFPAEYAGAGAGQGELVHGACDAHIGQAALLFDRFAGIVLDGLVAGKDIVLHAGDIDAGKFKALGTVEGHQKDAVVVVLNVVNIRDEGDIFEEAGQGRLSVLVIHPLLIISQLADQLFDIIFTVLRILFAGSPEGIDIAGVVEHMAGKLHQCMRQGIVAVVVDHVRKSTELEAGFFYTGDLVAFFHYGKKACVLLRGIFCGTAQGGGADAPLGDVDDAADGDVIAAVVDGLEIGQDVLDLAAGIEIGAADHVVGDGAQDEALLEKAGLGVCAVKDGKAVIALVFAAPDLVLDVLRHKGGLLHGGGKTADVDAGALAVVGPEGLVLAGAVVFDHGVGGIQDVLRGAIVLLQTDHQGVGIDFFKIQDISDIGASEFVDGLVVVAHHAEIFVGAGQQADQFELGTVGILIFVYHDVAETSLIHLQHFVVGMEKLHGQHEQIVKIQCIVFSEKSLILLVGHADLFFSEADAVVFLAILQGSDQLVFCSGNIGKDLALPEVFGVDLEGLADLFHQGLLIVRVVNGKSGLVSHQVDVAAQDPDAHGVESGDPDALGAAAQDLVHALPHLSGRLVGECDGEDIPGIHFALVDQICDAVGDDAGLAAAGARQDQDRALGLEAGLLLLAVECFVDGHIYVSFVIFPCQKSDQSVSRSFSIKSFLI